MMIQAVLGNPHHPEYGVATMPRDTPFLCPSQPAAAANSALWRTFAPRRRMHLNRN